MNNQELIKKYEEILINGKSDFKSAHIYQTFLKELRQLDEPQKPVVPQFVADWIEYCKITHVDLQHALIVGDVYFYNYANQEDFSKLKEFLETENNQETFARAWLDGYTVEKEKRYLVKMKSIDTNFNFLNRHRNENYWIFSRKDKNTLYQTQHTRKELEEAGLGWVFDSPGIEVEEVEE